MELVWWWVLVTSFEVGFVGVGTLVCWFWFGFRVGLLILICRCLVGKSGCGGLGLFYAFWFGGLWFAGWVGV